MRRLQMLLMAFNAVQRENANIDRFQIDTDVNALREQPLQAEMATFVR